MVAGLGAGWVGVGVCLPGGVGTPNLSWNLGSGNWGNCWEAWERSGTGAGRQQGSYLQAVGEGQGERLGIVWN